MKNELATVATPPADVRQARELIARVERLLWYDEDAGRCIALVLPVDSAKGKLPGKSAIGPLPALEFFQRGTAYRFMGRWQDDERRGPQFHFDAVVVERPLTRDGVAKYLIDNAPNVGEKTASALWERYQGDAIAVLRETPGRVQEDGIMSLSAATEASDALRKNSATERLTVELFSLLVGRGIGGRGITRCIEMWGAKAPRIIARNPFAMLTAEVPGAGFKRCDKAWIDFKLPPSALKRQLHCGLNFMQLSNDGHTWFRATEFCQYIVDTIPGGRAVVNPVRAIQMGKRAGLLRVRRDSSGVPWVADDKAARDEQSIADNLRRLMAYRGERLWPESIPVSGADGDRLPSQHQADRAREATAGPVGCLIGGPGTGKSHTLAYILRALIPRVGINGVAVASPTGKASVRATQAMAAAGLPIRATTIHRLLEIGRNGRDGKGWGFQRNRSNPLVQRVIVLDEMSMVSTDLMASFVEACPGGAHVLFIGDPHQLPPVGHGAPLRDMLAGGIPHGELREVRRNAGAIVHACVRIKAAEQFDTYADFTPEIGHNLIHYGTAGEAQSIDLLQSIMTTMKKFHPVWQTQILCGLNKKSGISRVAINERLHDLLNPSGRAEEGNPFRCDDKVICLRNGEYQIVDHDGYGAQDNADSYAPIKNWNKNEFGNLEDDSENYPNMLYVANGEIGRVEAVAARAMIVRIAEETLVKVPIGKPPKSSSIATGDDEADGSGEREGMENGRQSQWDLAYAISVHKSQGSESPCVIVMVDPAASRIASREFHYTAISRTSKLCILIGSMSVLRRQCAVAVLPKRKTFLAELIKQETTES